MRMEGDTVHFEISWREEICVRDVSVLRGKEFERRVRFNARRSSREAVERFEKSAGGGI